MDKQIITFSANQQHLHKTGGLDIFATKTVSYIEAHFDLGQNWSGYDSVEAVWWNDRTRPIRTVLDTEGICVVPPEVLTKKGEVYVNLVGVISTNDTLTDRLTTHPITALTNKFNAQLGEGTTTPLTPSEYEQFVASVKADADRAETAKDDARGFASDAETSAENAHTSEVNSGTSETNAKASEDNAKVSELNAEAYKNQAQASASSASASATSAGNSATQAENAKDDAEDARDEIRSMRAEATTLPAGSNATASYSGGLLSLGIPKGDKGDRGQQGIQGETGATPNLTIGTVETLEPTEDATATITGTAENPVLNLGIPQGEVGEVSYADLKTLLPMDTASGAIVSITDGQSVIPVDSLKVSLEPIQDLHGYDKPWSGGAEPNKLSESWVVGGINSATGDYTPQANTLYTTDFSKVTAGETYYLELPAGKSVYLFYYSTNDVSGYIGNSGGYKTTGAFTLPSGVNYIRAQLANTYGTVYNHDVAMNYPSSVTTYSPYSNTCPISGHTEVDTYVSPTASAQDATVYTTPLGQTVYGGVLDVVSGELVVDRKLIDMGGLDWAYQSSTQRFIVDIADAKRPPSNYVKANIICSIYETLSSSDTESSGNDGSIGMSQWGAVGVRDTAKGTSASDFKTTMNGVQLCYELATPTAIQLTPQEVKLLLGNNTIWSDGDVAIVYSADVTKWIEKQLS